MIRENAIGQPRWNSPLVRFFGMKVGGAVAAMLAPEIAPSFDVNQMDDPTLAFLRGERYASYGRVLAAVPAVYGSAALRNPANSGVLLTVEKIQAYTSGASNVVISTGILAADLTTSGRCTVLDSRWTAPLATTAMYSYRTDSAVSVSLARVMEVPSGTFGMLEIPLVIPAGYGLVIETSGFNVNLGFGFVFRERAITAEELATG